MTAWGPDRHRHPKMRKWSGGDSNPDFLCRRIDACVTTVPIRTAQPDTTPSSRFTETKPPRLTTDVHECWVLSCAKLTVSDGAQHLPAYTLRKSLTPTNNSAHILLALPPYLRGPIPFAVLIAGGGVTGLSPIPCGQTGCYSCEFYSVIGAKPSVKWERDA